MQMKELVLMIPQAAYSSQMDMFTVITNHQVYNEYLEIYNCAPTSGNTEDYLGECFDLLSVSRVEYYYYCETLTFRT